MCHKEYHFIGLVKHGEEKRIKWKDIRGHAVITNRLPYFNLNENDQPSITFQCSQTTVIIRLIVLWYLCEWGGGIQKNQLFSLYSSPSVSPLPFSFILNGSANTFHYFKWKIIIAIFLYLRRPTRSVSLPLPRANCCLILHYKSNTKPKSF